MRVTCPFCQAQVETNGQGERGEIKCPVCNAEFDLEMAILFSGSKGEETETKKTEAWFRDEGRVPEPEGQVKTGPITEAYIPESRQKDGKIEKVGTYGYTARDLRHATEVVFEVTSPGEGKKVAGQEARVAQRPSPSIEPRLRDDIFAGPEVEGRGAIATKAPPPLGGEGSPKAEPPLSWAGPTRQDKVYEPLGFRGEEEAATSRVKTVEEPFSLEGLGLGDGTDLELPESVATGEASSTLKSRAGEERVAEERQDISFEDLALGDLGAIEEKKSSDAFDFDLEAALREDSEPQVSIGVIGPEPQEEEVIEERASKPETGGLGLPDQWLDLPEETTEGAPSFELEELRISGEPPSPAGLELERREEPIPPIEPPVRREAKIKARRGGLRVVLVAISITILIGVVLGQTQYGYFGINLFLPEEKDMATSRRVSRALGETSGIVKDTPEAYRAEVSRLEAILREDKDNEGAKADLIEVLMRFRERFPSVFAHDERLSKRLQDLQREAQVGGEKASLVRVLELVSAGKYAEARALLDGMVISTAQDADILYFYGKIALGQEKLEEAQKYFELALLKNPASIPAKFFLSKTLLAMGKLAEAKKLLEEIVAQEPSHMASKVLLAKIALDGKDLESAARYAGEVVTKGDPLAYRTEVFEAHLILAEVAARKGNEEERIAELRAAVGIEPGHQETVVALATLLLASDKVEDAYRVIEPCWNSGCDSEEFLAVALETAYALEKDEWAEQILKKASEKFEKSPNFAIIKGRHFMERRQYRSAALAFEEALKVAEDSVDARLLLAEALRNEGKGSLAVRVLKDGIEKVGNKPPLLKALATLQREMRDLPGAEESLRTLVGVDPANLEAQELLGLVLLEMGRTEEAATILESLQARRALHKDGLLGLARAYLALQRPGKAKEVLARAVGGGEEDPVLKAEYGRALFEAGRLAEAEKVLNEVLASQPHLPVAHYYRGRLLAEKGEMKRAFEALTQAVQLDNKNTHYRLELARVLLKMGSEANVRDALMHLDNVIAAYNRGDTPPEEREADAFFLRGKVYFSQQKYSQARKDFEAALQMEPSRLDILVSYGQTLFELAMYDEAYPYIAQVLEREPNHPEGNFLMGKIWLRRGNVQKAREHFERLVHRYPSRYPEALRLLGLIYRDQNLIPLAKSTLADYLKYAPKGTPEAEEVARILERMK